MIKLDNNRKELYQWDVGVVGTLTIDGVDEVHFSNLRYGISFNVKVVDSKVKFPPEVLQSGADVFCWAFVRQENGGYTKKEQIFNVEKRPRPSDYVYEPTEILSWETLKNDITNLQKYTNESLTTLEKGTIKIITEPCHIAELEAGTYMVKSEPAGEYQGKVVFSNLNRDGIVADYFSLENGLLVVFRNDKSRGNYGEENSIVDFTAQGVMRIPDNSQKNDSLNIFNHTIDSATSVTCYYMKSVNRPENIGNLEANKWYSYLPDFSISDIPATAVIDNITEESTKYNLPNAVAVRNYVNANFATKAELNTLKTELQGNINEISALVGGA